MPKIGVLSSIAHRSSVYRCERIGAGEAGLLYDNERETARAPTLHDRSDTTQRSTPTTLGLTPTTLDTSTTTWESRPSTGRLTARWLSDTENTPTRNA